MAARSRALRWFSAGCADPCPLLAAADPSSPAPPPVVQRGRAVELHTTSRDAVPQGRRRRPGPSSPTLTRAVLRRRPWSEGAGPPSCTNRHSDAVQQHCRRPGTPSTSSVRTSKSIRPLLCHNLVFSAHFTFRKFLSHLKSN